MLMRCFDEERYLLKRRIELLDYMNETAVEYLITEEKDITKIKEDTKLTFIFKQYADVENSANFLKKLSNIYSHSPEIYGNISTKKRSKKK